MPPALFSLPLVRLRLYFTGPGGPVPDLHNRLRGRIGLLLRQRYCLGSGHCAACPLAPSCAALALFSGPGDQRPGPAARSRPLSAPFVLTPLPDADQGLHAVGLTLFGAAAQHAHSFLDVAVEALRRMRLGSGLASREVVAVEGTEEGVRTLATHIHCLAMPWLRIRMVSPLCCSGMPGRDADWPLFLVRAAVRRLRDLKRAHGTDTDMGRLDEAMLEAVRRAGPVRCRLRPCQASRHSQRQGRRLRLQGVRGEVLARDLPGEAVLLLKAAGITHLGKGATWGLGAVQVDEASDDEIA